MRKAVYGAIFTSAIAAVGMLVWTGPNATPGSQKRLSPRQHAPIRIHQQRERGQWDSGNWSGFAVTGAVGSVTDTRGSWVVPAANCSSSPTGYSSFWVGIDGFNSPSVEQIGTDSDCVTVNGRKSDTPTYYAWYEFYPQSSYMIEFPRAVQPGDVINAEIKYIGQSNPRHGSAASQFTVTLIDVTRNETFSVTSSVAGAKQSSAEWIAEAPCCTASGGVLPLANFNSVSFSSATATVSNTTGVIQSFGTNVQAITMTEPSSSIVKAQPSGLLAGGGSFFVNWLNPGP